MSASESSLEGASARAASAAPRRAPLEDALELGCEAVFRSGARPKGEGGR